jgi:hypothetical protein
MTTVRLFLVMAVLLHAVGVSGQLPPPKEISLRIALLEAWLAAVQRHRPGALDDSVRLVSSWNQEQLRLIWIDVRTIVSLVRVLDVSLFYITEDSGASTPQPAGGSRQVLYKRALERNPELVEARIRLGRVLGLRGHHDEAIDQLKQGLTTSEPLLQYYANLFLGAEFDALGNGAEARRSYERAAAIEPRAVTVIRPEPPRRPGRGQGSGTRDARASAEIAAQRPRTDRSLVGLRGSTVARRGPVAR